MGRERRAQTALQAVERGVMGNKGIFVAVEGQNVERVGAIGRSRSRANGDNNT